MVERNMTQYHYERPPTTAVEPADRKTVQDRSTLERHLKSLEERVDQQAADLREIQRGLRKLQNEVRVAVNTFNLTRRG